MVACENFHKSLRGDIELERDGRFSGDSLKFFVARFETLRLRPFDVLIEVFRDARSYTRLLTLKKAFGNAPLEEPPRGAFVDEITAKIQNLSDP